MKKSELQTNKFLEAIKDAIRFLLPGFILRYFYRWMTMNYLKSLDAKIDPTRKTILVINHFYDQDLRALQLANRRYNLVILDFEIMFKSGRLYFTKPVHNLLAPYDEEPEQNRLAFRRECDLMFAFLSQKFKPNCILTPSDSFAFIREFITVARQNGVPTVVFDKEGTVSPYALEAHAARIRNFAPFMSDHLYAWSERQRQFWNNVGVVDSKITVVGQARSDLFFAEKRHDVDKLFERKQPLITYFTLDDHAYIPPRQAERGLSWEKLKRETFEDLVAFAGEHSEYNFLVKAHPQQRDLVRLREKYEGDNFKVVGGAKIANELIQRSELIIAFQTTAIIEAMLLKRRVLYTAWDENYNRYLLDDLLPFHEAEGIIVARTRHMFKDVCRRFFAGDFSDFDFGPSQQKARDDFVNEYLWQPDGHVCERFFGDLDRLLGETTI